MKPDSDHHADNPFLLDNATFRELYRRSDRLRSRITSLKLAKCYGEDSVSVVTEAARRELPSNPACFDVGCGLGSGSDRIKRILSPSRIIALDRSEAMLRATEERVPGIEVLCDDFINLRKYKIIADYILAAFCLYHSAEPQTICSHLHDVLSPHGRCALVTKSSSSYLEMDKILTEAGIGAGAQRSLYRSFCTENCESIASCVFLLTDRFDHEQRFVFESPDHLASYVITSPKYTQLRGLSCDQVASKLERVWAKPLVVTSTTTALLCVKK